MPPLLLLIGSGRNAIIFSVSILHMASVCGQINMKLFLTILVNFTVGSPSHTNTMTPMKVFLLFSLWQKQLKTTFLAGKESTLQEQNLVFLLDNGIPIN
jgi:hypothetical protein